MPGRATFHKSARCLFSSFKRHSAWAAKRLKRSREPARSTATAGFFQFEKLGRGNATFLPELHYLSGFAEKLPSPDSFVFSVSREWKIKPQKFAQAQTDQVILRCKSMVRSGLGAGGAVKTARAAGEKRHPGTVGGILVVAARVAAATNKPESHRIQDGRPVRRTRTGPN